MGELEKRILDGAEELFLSLGLRSVSMDDLASKLGVSKKTIYKHYKDKANLIRCVAQKHLNCDEEDFQRIEIECKDPIDQMRLIADHARRSMGRMHPSVMFDLKKFYTESWSLIQEYHQTSIIGRICNNLREGVKLGFYSADIKADILGKLMYHEFEFSFDTLFLDKSEYKPVEVYNELFHHFMMRILTEKGKKLYERYEK